MLPVLFRPSIERRIRLPERRSGLDRELDRVFGHFFGPAGEIVAGAYPVDVWEDADHVYITADVPGFSKDDLEISVEDGVLSIAGERNTESEREEKSYRLRERCYGRFERRFRLPDHLDPNEVRANLKDGVLTVVLNRREETKPRKVEVKPADEDQG